MSWHWLDDRPLILAIAGSNGAGKTTFFRAHIQPAGLRFVNADIIASELQLGPYPAATVADRLRRELVRQRETFAFETVFSDPVGDKLRFLQEAAATGYSVALCFIGLKNVALSQQRVAMRVTQGGHDVPAEKLKARFPRTLANLRLAIKSLPHVLVFDNSDLANSYRRVAEFADGAPLSSAKLYPPWLKSIIR